MNFNVIPYAVSWAALALVVIALIIYRRRIADQEDDTLHVLEGERAISQQTAMAHKLDQIDRWGKILTVVVVLYGLAVLAWWMYAAFNVKGVVME